MRIENDRLVIRSLKKSGSEKAGSSQMRSAGIPYLPTFLTELQGTTEEAMETIQHMTLSENRQCILGVYEKTDLSVLIGLAELYDFKPSGKVISLGYRFLPEYWGKGIATSCVCALLDYVQHNTDVELVTAHVIPENKASAQCLLKNGFEYLLTKPDNWGYSQPVVAEVYVFDCHIPALM